MCLLPGETESDELARNVSANMHLWRPNGHLITDGEQLMASPYNPSVNV